MKLVLVFFASLTVVKCLLDPPDADTNIGGSLADDIAFDPACTKGAERYDQTAFDQVGTIPVSNPRTLECRFDTSCCWKNHDQSALRFVKGVDSARACNPGASPDGPFLLYQAIRPADGEVAVFHSCNIICSRGEVTVAARHWQSQGVRLEACIIDVFDENARPRSCQEFRGNNRPVILPQLYLSGIALIASNFQNPGDNVIIDDLQIDFQVCDPEDTAEEALAKVCQEVSCSMTEGNMCGWKSFEDRKWEARAREIITGNMDSGVNIKLLSDIKSPPHVSQSGYAGVAVNGYETVTLTAPSVELPSDVEMAMKVYEACRDHRVDVCVDGQCTPVTNPDASPKDRQWQEVKVLLPAGTRQIQIKAVNSGKYQCAAGVSHITIREPGQGFAPLC